MRTLKLLTPLAAVSLLLAGCTGDKEPQPEPDNQATEEANLPDADTTALERPSGGLGDYSAEELHGAYSVASEYIVASLTTPELLSGEWWQEGHDMEFLTTLGSFSEKLEEDITKLDPEDAVGAQATQSIALFLTETDTITAPLECKTEGECSDEPFYGKAVWESETDDVVRLEVSASVVRPLMKEEEETKSLDTYTYKIHMSEQDGEWVINQIQNSYEIGKEEK